MCTQRSSGQPVFKIGGPFQFKTFVKPDDRKNNASAQGRHRRRHRGVSARGRRNDELKAALPYGQKTAWRPKAEVFFEAGGA